MAPLSRHPHPRSPHPSLTGRGERPLGFRQAPGQPPPRPQPGPASSIKAGFNCTNKCLPGSFFFFSNREGQPARIRKFRNVLPSPSPATPGGRVGPQREGHARSWLALQNDPSPLGAQGTRRGTHSWGPIGPLAPGPRRPGRAWVDTPPGGPQGLAPHSMWPMWWALIRVQTRSLVAQLPPTCHCDGDFLPPTGQPLTLHSDISTLVRVRGWEPNKQGVNLKKQQWPGQRGDRGHPPPGAYLDTLCPAEHTD